MAVHKTAKCGVDASAFYALLARITLRVGLLLSHKSVLSSTEDRADQDGVAARWDCCGVAAFAGGTLRAYMVGLETVPPRAL